ncbi:MAG: hypothetical protein ACOCP8_06945 [archaeon]
MSYKSWVKENKGLIVKLIGGIIAIFALAAVFAPVNLDSSTSQSSKEGNRVLELDLLNEGFGFASDTTMYLVIDETDTNRIEYDKQITDTDKIDDLSEKDLQLFKGGGSFDKFAMVEIDGPSLWFTKKTEMIEVEEAEQFETFNVHEIIISGEKLLFGGDIYRISDPSNVTWD